jgi:hypothetical protein
LIGFADRLSHQEYVPTRQFVFTSCPPGLNPPDSRLASEKQILTQENTLLKMSKIPLLTTIGVFTMLSVGSIVGVHATDDYSIGYDAGRTKASSDFTKGVNDDSCNDGSISYCSGYIDGYNDLMHILMH